VHYINYMHTPNAFPIGTQFYGGNKRKDVCTVTDILKTYNSAGELVSVRYMAIHQFCGQTIVDRDVVAVTIARGFIQ